MTTLKIVEEAGSAGTDTQDHSPADLARGYLLGTPLFHVIVKIAMGLAAVLLSAALDIGLMYNANSARFLDAFGNSVGSTLALWTASTMSLGIFWIIGAAYDLGGKWRWLAGLIYALLVAFLAVLLLPDWIGLFANVLSGGGAGAFDHGTYVPLALIYLGTAIIAVFYTTGGVLWLQAKKYLTTCWAEWRNYKEAIERKRVFEKYINAASRRRRIEVDIEHQTANGRACVEAALPGAIDAYRSMVTDLLNHALAVCRGIKYTKAAKSEARKDISVLEACLKSLNAIKLVCMLALVLACGSPPAQATPATDDILASAPVFQLLIDVSGNSSGLNNDYLNSVLPEIDKRLRGMPLGATVLVTTIGDATVSPIVFRTRIQIKHTSEGDTLDHIAHDLRELVLSFPERMHGKEQMQSELIGGFFDAAQAVNQQAHGNVIVAISDLIEISPLARCDQKARKPCKLPAPSFHLPKDTAVAVYGIGQGLHSDRSVLLTQQWATFFKRAGVGAELRRN